MHAHPLFTTLPFSHTVREKQTPSPASTDVLLYLHVGHCNNKLRLHANAGFSCEEVTDDERY